MAMVFVLSSDPDIAQNTNVLSTVEAPDGLVNVNVLCRVDSTAVV
jgi:hypothetical protein